MEVGGGKYRRGKGNQVFRIHFAEERRNGKTDIRKSQESDNSDEKDMKHWREVIQR